jgi:hypothetical protein
MLLTKSVFSLPSNTQILLGTDRHSLMNIPKVYGIICLKYSIIMEYADKGDLYQKIS